MEAAFSLPSCSFFLFLFLFLFVFPFFSPGAGGGAPVRRGDARCQQPNPKGTTHLNDIILLLEDSTGQRALTPIVQPVGFGAVLDEEADEVGVAMVGSEHELLGVWPTRGLHQPRASDKRQARASKMIKTPVGYGQEDKAAYQCIAFFVHHVWRQTSSDGLLYEC